jgi:hypothetical protein
LWKLEENKSKQNNQNKNKRGNYKRSGREKGEAEGVIRKSNRGREYD